MSAEFDVIRFRSVAVFGNDGNANFPKYNYELMGRIKFSPSHIGARKGRRQINKMGKFFLCHSVWYASLDTHCGLGSRSNTRTIKCKNYARREHARLLG